MESPSGCAGDRCEQRLTEMLAGPFEIESLNVVGVANQQGASRLRSVIY